MYSPIHGRAAQLYTWCVRRAVQPLCISRGKVSPPAKNILFRRIGSLSSSTAFTTGAASCFGFRTDVESSDSSAWRFQERAACILRRDGESVFAIRQPGRNDECELWRIVDSQHIEIDRRGLFFAVGDVDADRRIRTCDFQHTAVDRERTTRRWRWQARIRQRTSRFGVRPECWQRFGR